MDKDMVMYAKGRPQQRIRDKDEQGQDYEEWIYGKPPEEVDFVRFKGNEVARLEVMTVDGKKSIHTEREIDLPAPRIRKSPKRSRRRNHRSLPRCAVPARKWSIPQPTPRNVPNVRRILRTLRIRMTLPPTSSTNPAPPQNTPTTTPPINPNAGPPHIVPAS